MHYTIRMMRKLLPVLMAFGMFLLVGNQMTRSAESKSIISGTSRYDRMKATINVSMEIVGKPKETGGVVFQHKQGYRKNLIISFLGCTKRVLNFSVIISMKLSGLENSQPTILE